MKSYKIRKAKRRMFNQLIQLERPMYFGYLSQVLFKELGYAEVTTAEEIKETPVITAEKRQPLFKEELIAPAEGYSVPGNQDSDLHGRKRPDSKQSKKATRVARGK